jgi:hypothetical protein
MSKVSYMIEGIMSDNFLHTPETFKEIWIKEVFRDVPVACDVELRFFEPWGPEFLMLFWSIRRL